MKNKASCRLPEKKRFSALCTPLPASCKIQELRFAESENIYCNSQMSAKQLRTICKISPECNQLLKAAVERIGLSARAYDRILKVARTIADLAGSNDIQAEHLAEAIQYRNLDREGWAG